MAITDKTRKTLWGRSGNRCAICKTELVLEKDTYDNIHSNIGEECHIISKQSNGPRHQNLDTFDFDSSDNLILLCANHHKTIDELVSNYSVEKLKQIKHEHELWVKNNLNTIGDISQEASSKFDDIINFVTAKHDLEMNIKSNRQVFESPEGLQIAFREVELIKTHVKELVAKIVAKATSYNIKTRDNRHRLTDIMFNGFTLLIQFYQGYANTAEKSYLLFAIVDGSFNEEGRADVFYPATMKDIIRLDFDFNTLDQFGWRDQEKKNDFYLSNEITEKWVEKYFKVALESKDSTGKRRNYVMKSFNQQ